MDQSAKETSEDNIIYDDEGDILVLLTSWMGKRSPKANQDVIRLTEVDRENSLAAGSAEKHIERAAATFDYVVSQRGKRTIRFKKRRDDDDIPF